MKKKHRDKTDFLKQKGIALAVTIKGTSASTVNKELPAQYVLNGTPVFSIMIKQNKRHSNKKRVKQ